LSNLIDEGRISLAISDIGNDSDFLASGILDTEDLLNVISSEISSSNPNK
jgi:hypothetical protein